jgi:hypothetical protein
MITTFYLADYLRWFNIPGSLTEVGVVTVSIDPQFVLSLIGLLFTIAVQTWAIVKFMITRADNDKKEVMDRIEKENDEVTRELRLIYDKINSVKDEYVRKGDVEKELDRIYKTLADFKFDLSGQLTSLNARFDSVLNMLNARKVTPQ